MIQRLKSFCIAVCVVQSSLAAAQGVAKKATDAQRLHAGCYVDQQRADPTTWTLLPTLLGNCKKSGPVKSKWFIYLDDNVLMQCRAERGGKPCPKRLPAGVNTALSIEETYTCQNGRHHGVYTAKIKPVTRVEQSDVKKFDVMVEGRFQNGTLTKVIRTKDSSGQKCREVFVEGGQPVKFLYYAQYGEGVQTVDEFDANGVHLFQRRVRNGKVEDTTTFKPDGSFEMDPQVYGKRYKFYLIGTLKAGLSSPVTNEGEGMSGLGGVQLNAGYLPCQDGVCVGGVLTLGIDRPTQAKLSTTYAEVGGLIYSWYVILYAGAGPRSQMTDDGPKSGFQATAAFGLLFASLYGRYFEANERSGFEFGLQLHAPIIF